MAQARKKAAPAIQPGDTEALDALADVFWREALAELEQGDAKPTSNTRKKRDVSAELEGPTQ